MSTTTLGAGPRAIRAALARPGIDHLLLADGSSRIVTRVRRSTTQVQLTVGILLPEVYTYDRATILRVIRTQDAD